MKHPKPTKKMIDYCERISKKCGIELPDGYDTSFRVARKYLDQYSPQFLGYKESLAKKRTHRADSPDHSSRDDSEDFTDVDSESIEEQTPTNQFKYLFRLFFTGCWLILLSVFATWLFGVEDSEAVNLLSFTCGVFLLLGVMLVFCSLAALVFQIPVLTLAITSLFFSRLRVSTGIALLVLCLLRPWVPGRYNTGALS